MVLTLFVLPYTAAHAGTVIIEGNVASKPFSVHIKEAPLEDVLRKLGKTFSFTVSGFEKTNSKNNISGEFSGTLNVVLQRLLRNRNHMIIRSHGTNAKISKIVMLNGANNRQAPATEMRSRTPTQLAPSVRQEHQKQTKREKLMTWHALRDKALKRRNKAR